MPSPASGRLAREGTSVLPSLCDDNVVKGGVAAPEAREADFDDHGACGGAPGSRVVD